MKEPGLTITRQELGAILRSEKLPEARRRFSGQTITIQCSTIRAIAYRDVIEILLYLCGVKSWQWIDGTNRDSPRIPLLTAGLRLARDAAIWPFAYLYQLLTTYRIARKPNLGKAQQKNLSILYLRTDHWFGLKSGGSVAHVSGVINGLQKLRPPVEIVSTDYLTDVAADAHFHLCEPTYEIGRNLPNMPEMMYNGQIVRFVEASWGQWRPSFIYQRYSLGNYAGAYLAQKYAVPLVCEYNGSPGWVAVHWEGQRLFHGRLLGRIEDLNLQVAQVVVVVSRQLRNEIVSRGIAPDKILINPNGVDPEEYSPDTDGSVIRRQYGFGRKMVIGFIGTFGRWHGAEVLAEAFGKLLRKFPTYRKHTRMLMIGDGPTMPRVRQVIADYGISDVCILTGQTPQQEGPHYLAACDVLVSPHVPNPDGTPFFGSPTKLFEYMAMGKGIVASDLEQIGEILEHDRTAWMIEAGNADDLMSGLKTLIDDGPRRKRLGQAARAEVVAKYTWQKHTQRIIEKLREPRQ